MGSVGTSLVSSQSERSQRLAGRGDCVIRRLSLGAKREDKREFRVNPPRPFATVLPAFGAAGRAELHGD